MPRRREVEKRNILPDPKFGSQVLSKFMNIIMESGKKAVAEKIVYGALDIAATKSKKEAIDIFTQALEAVKPVVELKSRRVGGANYQDLFSFGAMPGITVGGTSLIANGNVIANFSNVNGQLQIQFINPVMRFILNV